MITENKITSKALGADKETIQGLVFANKNKVIPLYDIVGGAFMATLEEGEGDKSDYIKLQGNFNGISILTGEEITSGVALLPAVAASFIAGKLLASKKADNEMTGVKIALTISAKYNVDSATSYVFVCEMHNEDGKIFDELKALLPDRKTKKLAKV